MKITNIFNAAGMGSFKEFKNLYKPYLDYAMSNDRRLDFLDIIKFEDENK